MTIKMIRFVELELEDALDTKALRVITGRARQARAPYRTGSLPDRRSMRSPAFADVSSGANAPPQQAFRPEAPISADASTPQPNSSETGPTGSHRRLEIPSAQEGVRLDKALATLLPEHSRSEIAGWIKQGLVHVDGVSRKPGEAVTAGEQVDVRIPPPRSTHLIPEDLPLDIRYEDASIIVVAKPTGLTVHPGAGQKAGTLANALVHHFQQLPELMGADRPGIVHRLDKDTSGVMVVAKTDLAQRRLSAAFAERTVHKTYLAVVHGIPDDATGRIEGRIGRSPNHRTKMAIREDGRDAATEWRVLERFPRHALLACEPVTGRTHQLRVHLKSIDHPILGDPLYGRGRGHMGEAIAPRLMLHAWRLDVPHPDDGRRVQVEAPVDEDWRRALAELAALPPLRRR